MRSGTAITCLHICNVLNVTVNCIRQLNITDDDDVHLREGFSCDDFTDTTTITMVSSKYPIRRVNKRPCCDP